MGNNDQHLVSHIQKVNQSPSTRPSHTHQQKMKMNQQTRVSVPPCPAQSGLQERPLGPGGAQPTSGTRWQEQHLPSLLPCPSFPVMAFSSHRKQQKKSPPASPPHWAQHRGRSPGHPSGLWAALLVVHLHLVLDAVVQLEVVVLQRGGAPWGQPGVRARAVEKEPGADGPEEDAERAHRYDGHQDGIQGVEPVFFFVQLWGSWRVSREQCVVPIRSKVICGGMGTYYPGNTLPFPSLCVCHLELWWSYKSTSPLHGYISAGFTNPGLEVMQSTELPRKLGALIRFCISDYVNSTLALYTHWNSGPLSAIGFKTMETICHSSQT